MRNLISISLLLGWFASISQTLDEMQYAAYLTVSKTMWERSIEKAESATGAQSFEKALAMYGLLNSTMASRDKDTFEVYVDQTVDLLKAIIDQDPEWGEPKAVLSSVYGLIMAYSPMKGIIYGSKSSSLMDDAMRKQNDSPMVQKLYGGSKLYTPKMFGGDPEEAVKAFEKAIEIYEQGETNSNWMYLDTMVGLSMAYQKTEKTDQAKTTLNKALEVEPEYYWAKSILASLSE